MAEAQPDLHDQKYDRQLRLWGGHGQRSLEQSNCLLVGANSAGTETLKNLILPGMGGFAIVDDKVVSNRDLGNNFFVELNSVGKSRAEVTKDLLHELNPDVRSSKAINMSVEELVKDPNNFNDYNVVVATEVAEPHMIALSKICWEKNIPFVAVRVFGFIGYVRVQRPEHVIIESKPEFPAADLRISKPFKELSDFSDGFDLASLNSAEHSHVPYPVILLKARDAWLKAHDGKEPANRDEKNAFKKQVSTMTRSAGEANFGEAYKNSHHTFGSLALSSSVKEIMNDPKAQNLTKDSSDFWVLVNAVKAFFDKEGVLPIAGGVPDMTADTQSYIQLQNIYGAKFAADLKAVTDSVNASLKAIGRKEGSISAEYCKRFVKHARYLRLLRYTPLHEEYTAGEKFNVEALDDDYEKIGAPWYVCLRAAYRHHAKTGSYPGPKDLDALANEVTALVAECKMNEDVVAPKHVEEMCRYAACELHSISSILGGIASQEIIKLVTAQWVPLNNTFVFNGITSGSASYTF